VRRHASNISADEDLEDGALVVAGQADDGKTIATAILDSSTAALRLVAGTMLLLRLGDDLQLHQAIVGAGDAVQRGGGLSFVRHPGHSPGRYESMGWNKKENDRIISFRPV